MNKVAVYTAIIGNYDDLRDPEYVNNTYDYFCFTDNHEIKSTDIWKVVYVNRDDYEETVGIDNVRFARYIKVMGFNLLPDYKYLIWVDSNTIMTDNFDSLISEYGSGKDWILFKHTQRNCIYSEASACIDWNLDNVDIIKNQIKKFKDEGYPENFGLIETNVMYRVITDEVKTLCKLWWSIIKSGSRRDQLSQMYCFWKLGMEFDLVPNRAKDTKWFKLVDHKGDRRYHVV